MGLARRHSIDAHAQIIPRSLAGNRVGIGILVAPVRRQKLRDQVVEVGMLCGYSGAAGSRFQAPTRLPIAFQVQTVSRLTPSISLMGTRISSLTARQPYPVVLFAGRAPVLSPG